MLSYLAIEYRRVTNQGLDQVRLRRQPNGFLIPVWRRDNSVSHWPDSPPDEATLIAATHDFQKSANGPEHVELLLSKTKLERCAMRTSTHKRRLLREAESLASSLLWTHRPASER